MAPDDAPFSRQYRRAPLPRIDNRDTGYKVQLIAAADCSAYTAVRLDYE
jgi:hypothetical protein